MAVNVRKSLIRTGQDLEFYTELMAMDRILSEQEAAFRAENERLERASEQFWEDMRKAYLGIYP